MIKSECSEDDKNVFSAEKILIIFLILIWSIEKLLDFMLWQYDKSLSHMDWSSYH